ncbi:hypothetical protein SK128_021665 [Halocaridina rubra]|uniref:Uncharacterized protein n=1 Tax=Halocaridina rubra TaxID=373956 RepID=A0AAN9A904_HALRR
MPSLSTIIMFVGGVIAIVAIIVIFVITVRIKMRKQSHKCVRRAANAGHSHIPKKPSLEGIVAAATTSNIPPAHGSFSKRDSLHPKDALQLQGPFIHEAAITHHSPHASHSVHSSHVSQAKESIPLQPIIRQPSKSLQPIIKDNGRSEKSSQGRTVLFVEPPKAQSGILVNKNEMPRSAYDVYPTRRRPREHEGDTKYEPYVHRGSYSEVRSSYWADNGLGGYYEMELPPRRYRSLDDGEDCGGIMRGQYSPDTSMARDIDYYQPYTSSFITNPPYSARELPSRELPREYVRDPRRDISRDARGITRELSREHTRDSLRERDRDRDRDRDIDQGHIFAFPSRSLSSEYDHPQPTSIMKRSPSMSASVGRPYEKGMRRSEWDRGGTYRSLPRPGKTRDEAEEDVLRKYRSLDRRFDLPFSGSLLRPEPECEPCDDHHQQQSQRRYSGSPRLRFADEKHFHLYHDKEKKQSGVNDRDESFI